MSPKVTHDGNAHLSIPSKSRAVTSELGRSVKDVPFVCDNERIIPSEGSLRRIRMETFHRPYYYRQPGAFVNEMKDSSVSEGRSASGSIVETIAAREGVDPVDLEVPLYDAVDPDALDRLVERASDGRASLQVEFSYCGYDVSVTSDGAVHVTVEE